MTVVARELGLTGNGLSKICDRVLVPYPARGYWSRARAGRADAPSPLPPAPEGVGEAIVISAQRAASRRPRTRVSADVRREQLMGAAAEIIASDGLAEVTMKAVARRVGISEAMAHNYFPQRRDLLLAIARRELHAMETHRRRALMRGHNRQARVMLSTVTYLQQVAERGALVQILTQSSEIRSALRAERDVTRRWDGDQTSKELEDRYGVPRELAQAATTVLTAVSLRAGRLLAGGKLSLQAAQDLTLAITGAGNRAVFGGELARGGP
ncbi:MAG TPA: TetR/AcrR family transcriptional regulator [Phenylobacterium sp.]|nr:TetR/AcrR family transcriptional regulator [Phenylobacterium sp.]